MVPLSPAAQGPFYLLAGYLFVHIFNRFITAYVCDRPTTAQYAIGLIPMLGIGFHSFIDGMIYSVTFSVSVFTGALAAIGMVLHEFPEGIVTYVLMIRAGFSDRKPFLLAFLAAALTTPLGTLASSPSSAGSTARFSASCCPCPPARWSKPTRRSSRRTARG
ncbi:MAG: ZIP family metal transporter [Defluviicoccus sp.]|nr:ZIP family metal transporter [Defluviicoccus sp.]